MVDEAILRVARDWLLESGWTPAQDTEYDVTAWYRRDDEPLLKFFPHYVADYADPLVPWLSPAMVDALKQFGVDTRTRSDRLGRFREDYEPIHPRAQFIDPLENPK